MNDVNFYLNKISALYQEYWDIDDSLVTYGKKEQVVMRKRIQYIEDCLQRLFMGDPVFRNLISFDRDDFYFSPDVAEAINSLNSLNEKEASLEKNCC